MKTNELRNLNKEELAQKLNASYEELSKLNYQKRVGNLDKPHKFRVVHKDIARIKTILREQELKSKNTER
jgi:large subunit ribosomal protein L29